MAYTVASERAYMGKESAALLSTMYKTLAAAYDEAKTTVLEDKEKAKKIVTKFLKNLKAALLKHTLGIDKVDESKVLADDLLAAYFGLDTAEIEKQGASGDLQSLQGVTQQTAAQYEGNLHRACYNRLDAPEKEKVVNDIEGFLKRKFKGEARKELLKSSAQGGQFWTIHENARLQPKEEQGKARQQFLNMKGLETLLEEETA